MHLLVFTSESEELHEKHSWSSGEWLQLKLQQAQFICKVLKLHQLAQFGVPPNP